MNLKNLGSLIKRRIIYLVSIPGTLLARFTLSRSRGPFRMLVDGVRDYAIITLDTCGRVTSWNCGAEHLQMYSPQEVQGVHFAYFFSNAEIIEGKPQKLLDAAFESGSAEAEGWQYRKDGTRFLARVVVSVMTGADGNLFGYSVVTQDITAQRQLEKDLRSAKHKAEIASQAKTTFLANISHELRNPLGAILGFSELIGDPSISNNERREYASVIARNGHQLIKLIDDLLDLSKAEVNRLRAEANEFNLMGLLEHVVYNSEVQIIESKKPIQLIIEFLGPVPTLVISDPFRIKQILLNLTGNAIKFTDAGRIVLHVQCSSIEGSNKQRLEFTVRDTGIGIAKDHWDHLFQPFSQADNSTTRQFGGTGLGLALSRQLAQMMEGDLVLASSEVGKGSVFRAHVQVEPSHRTSFRSNLPSKELTNETSKTSSPNLPNLHGLSVLLVEDNIDNQHLITHILKQAKVQVVIAQNGQEGLEMASRGHFDLILMDIQMPIMDGYSATRRLRELNCKTPIIAVTAHAFKDEHSRCLQAGFNDQISKPINRHLLLTKISEFTGDKESAVH